MCLCERVSWPDLPLGFAISALEEWKASEAPRVLRFEPVKQDGEEASRVPPMLERTAPLDRGRWRGGGWGRGPGDAVPLQ